MRINVLPFLFVIFLLLSGCSYTGQPDDAGYSILSDEAKVSESGLEAGGYIAIHSPESDTLDDVPDPSLQVDDSRSYSVPDAATSVHEASSDGEAEARSDNESNNSAQVPIYPVDEDKNFGSDHSFSSSDEAAGFTPDSNDSEESFPENHEDAEALTNYPEKTQEAVPYQITAYVMNTSYVNEDGENILALHIFTPVIELESTDSEVYFNKYYNTRALEYALYINETVFPALEASLQTSGANVQLSSAEMKYSILYNTEDYLCVAVSYTEELPERLEKREVASIFDMKNATLIDEWEVNEDADKSSESILERIVLSSNDNEDHVMNASS